MEGKQRRPGFTLTELVVVIAMLGVLAAIFLTVLVPARKMALVTTCTSHLRQIGMAYKMYVADYGQYPNPGQFTASPYVKNRAVLFCPEDEEIKTTHAASSYRYRYELPPNFAIISLARDLDPNIVLARCSHHLEQRTIILKGDNSRMTPPRYPFQLILRAGGTVERIHIDRIQQFLQSGEDVVLRSLYPGEPGYEMKTR